jgi:hypothetical protein
MNNMETVEQVKKAFREARIAGEQMLQAERITWEQFQFTMSGFELKLQSMGVNI